jgi:hypothetical protein
MLGHSIVSQHFMESEGSIPSSQELSTCSYPEPDKSSPHHPISLRSILILCTHLRLGLPSSLFPPGFPTNNLYAFFFSPIRATCPAHLILLDLIILIILGEVNLIPSHVNPFRIPAPHFSDILCFGTPVRRVSEQKITYVK